MSYQKPIRFFEEQGVVSPEQCYYVTMDNIANTKKQDILTMVNLGRFFTIFAPRQSGKTTFFFNFCRSLENDSMYISILLSFQRYQTLDSQSFYERIYKSIKRQLLNRLKVIQCKEYKTVADCMQKTTIHNHNDFYDLFEQLNHIIHYKKIVIFIDEFEGIPFSELENFLMTLRDLYQNYKLVKEKALYSVGLVGIRNIVKLVVGGISPFNIADQVSLPLFSFNNVRNLYGQYTQETNQPFTKEAVVKIFDETCGQPWMVNRLGTILTTEIKPETSDPINENDVDNAIGCLVKEQNSHFENLHEKINQYQDTFLQLIQKNKPHDPNDSEQNWLMQYGLIKVVNGHVTIANPIYKKRFMSLLTQKINPVDSNHQKNFFIFLCYAKEDIHMVRNLYDRLKNEGLTPWLDEVDILPGQNWSCEIQRAIDATDFALICLSSISVQKKGFLNKEIHWALDKQAQMPEKQSFIIPVKLEPCELQQKLSDIQSVNLFEKNGFNQLIRALSVEVKNKSFRKDFPELSIDPFETIDEFKQRIEKFGSFQVGTGRLMKENYLISSGKFPIDIQWEQWTQKNFDPQNHSSCWILAKRDIAKQIYQTRTIYPILGNCSIVEKSLELTLLLQTHEQSFSIHTKEKLFCISMPISR